MFLGINIGIHHSQEEKLEQYGYIIFYTCQGIKGFYLYKKM